MQDGRRAVGLEVHACIQSANTPGPVQSIAIRNCKQAQGGHEGGSRTPRAGTPTYRTYVRAPRAIEGRQAACRVLQSHCCIRVLIVISFSYLKRLTLTKTMHVDVYVWRYTCDTLPCTGALLR